MPWHYARLLEEATACILLQRVGGGYRFIPPLFQDFFASLNPIAPSLPFPSSLPLDDNHNPFLRKESAKMPFFDFVKPNIDQFIIEKVTL